MTNNASYPLGPIAPSVSLNGIAITPGSTVYNPPLKRLWVGGTGDITITMPQTGTGLVLTAVPAGTMIDGVAILSITAASATDIIGFW